MQYPNATELDVGARTQCGLNASLDGCETRVLLGRWPRTVADCCCTAGEVRRICEAKGENTIGRRNHDGIALTVFFLEVVPTLGPCVRRADPLHLESFHHLIQQPVDDLESCALVTPNGRRVPHIPRLPLQAQILEHNVGRLEHLDRERMRPVFSDRLE